MKYLCLAYYDHEKLGALSKAEFDAIVSKCPAYDAALWKSGQVLFSASLGEAKSSASIRPKAGKVSITDGPFTEAKEMIGGFFMIEADSAQDALAIASNHPAAHLGEHVGWGIEVRPVGRFFDGPP